MAKLICCCSDAAKNCDKICPKGMLLEPVAVYQTNWPRSIHMQLIKQLRLKQLRELRRGV